MIDKDALCRNCEHWIGHIQGNCRKHAPIGFIGWSKHFDDTQEVRTGWPETSHDDSCGDFSFSGMIASEPEKDVWPIPELPTVDTRTKQPEQEENNGQ